MSTRQRFAPQAEGALARSDRLPDYIDRLYRAAWALCGSRHDAEDLGQGTFATLLKRPRLLHTDNEIGYLLRALRKTYADRYRTAARRPTTRQLFEDDAASVDDRRVNACEIMQAIASAPAPYRDAVIAVDLIGSPTARPRAPFAPAKQRSQHAFTAGGITSRAS